MMGIGRHNSGSLEYNLYRVRQKPDFTTYGKQDLVHIDSYSFFHTPPLKR